MSWNYAVIDPATGKIKNSGTSLGSAGVPVDREFPVTAEGGQTVFQLSDDITDDTVIHTMWNGVEYAEGADRNWTRDSANNRIVFNFTIPKNGIVRVRLYL